MRLMRVLQALCLIFSVFVLTGCVPVARFTVTPATLVVGQVATFDASSSCATDNGVTLVSYEWDFGDGSKASGKVAPHTYDKPGEYNVALTVTDSNGQTDVERRKISVTSDAVESPGKLVFAHYFPPYPISLDNEPPAEDYYTTQYLTANPTASQEMKHAKYGGLLRDRPLERMPISGDYQQTDMQTEVQNAKKAGINGFAACILTLDTTDRNWTLVEKLMKAAASEGSFSVMLQPDMSGSDVPGLSASDFASGMAKLAKYDAVYRLSTGEVVISPFYAEAKTPSWYAEALSLLKSQYGISAVMLPLFLDATNMADYASISVGFGNWGIRNTAAAASWTNWAEKAHALGKLWMEPVSVQDVRPNQQIYDEASNTETLAATWNRAISQNAEMVLLPTWNDYSESTSFAPSVDHGWAFLNLNQYYLTKYKTGSAKVTNEQVIISHRIQKFSTEVTYSATMSLREFSTAPRDKIEVVTLLTAPATVSVTIGGATNTYSAPAGNYAKLYDLQEGYFTAAVTRGASTVATVTTKDVVSFAKTAQQDLTYHAVTSAR